MSWRGEANRGWREKVVRPVGVERVQRVDEAGRRSGVGDSVLFRLRMCRSVWGSVPPYIEV